MSFYKFILRKLKTADLLLLYTVSLNDFSGENFFKNLTVQWIATLIFIKLLWKLLGPDYLKYCEKLPFSPSILRNMILDINQEALPSPWKGLSIWEMDFFV